LHAIGIVARNGVAFIDVDDPGEVTDAARKTLPKPFLVLSSWPRESGPELPK
jgi:hypothetical protein